MSEKSAVAVKHAECLSMTGYAQARAELDGWSLRVSVKSVNHRFLDLKMRLRQVVRERIVRGHIELKLSIEPDASKAVQVNRELLRAYLHAAQELRSEAGITSEVDIVGLLRLPGVAGGLAPTVPESEEEQEALGQAIDRCLREALAKLDEMRRAEGRH